MSIKIIHYFLRQNLYLKGFILLFLFIIVILFICSFYIFSIYHPCRLFYNTNYKNIPILIYHGVSKSSNDEYIISYAKFKNQMHYLQKNDYSVISLSEYIDSITHGTKLPQKSIIIIFHDNHIGWYDLVFTLLKENNFNASFFVITSITPDKKSGDRIGWKELKEIGSRKNKNGKLLFTIESHSLSHYSLMKKRQEQNEQYENRVYNEFAASYEIIKNKIGIAPKFFALPFGKGFSKKHERDFIIKTAKNVGYMGIQEGHYFTEGAYRIGGMTIHNTNSSDEEFALALKIFMHDSCISDFFSWLLIAIERGYYKLIHI